MKIGIAWGFEGSNYSSADYDDLSCGPKSAFMRLSKLEKQLYASLFSHVDTRFALGKAEWLRVQVYNARSRVIEEGR